MKVIKRVLKPEGVANRQAPVLGKTLQSLCGLRRPPRSARNHQGALRLHQHLAQGSQRSRVAPCIYRLNPWQCLRPTPGDRIGLQARGQHVFGQHQHHRSGSTIHGGGIGARHVLRDTPCIVNAFNALGHPTGAGPEHGAVVHLLKGFAVSGIAGNIAHEENHWRGVLKGGVHTDGCVGGTRRTGHKAQARASAELAMGFCHKRCPALLAVDDKLNLVAVKMKSVKDRQVALSWNAKSVGCALLDQTPNQQVARDLRHREG